jgi:hypothetical protein
VGGVVAIGVEGFSVELRAVGITANEGLVAVSFGLWVVEGTLALGAEGFSVDLLVVEALLLKKLFKSLSV